jgi:nucleoid-associated protein YgaU
VIYSFSSHADHVAIYVGGGQTIDTASHHPNGGVGYSSLQRAGGTIAGVVRPAAGDAPQVLREAAPAPVTPRLAPVAPRPVHAAAGTYTVVPGDTLYAIARSHGHYHWRAIYNLNRDQIDDPHWIYPGQVLRLPGGPSAAA